MSTKQDFIKDGFIVEENKISENKLIKFLRENYPQVIKDNEIKINELKEIINLPTDEKLNGYGLNFIGRQVAKATYKQKTDKVLKINKQFSKEFDTTQNIVIKGDNLDSLKILKNYYSNKIKCIYIDPPYNTNSEDFTYKDDFKKEELNVLGLSNISQEEYERLEFSFKTPKSHNGWLTFMYPRLKLAYDLLSDDGVIFISIDDNEQANLKLLCDEIFGEENFVSCVINQSANSVFGSKASAKENTFIKIKDYVLVYRKQDNMKLNTLYTKSENQIYTSHDFVLEKGIKLSTVDWFKKYYKDKFDYYKMKITKDNIEKILKIDNVFCKEVVNKLLDIQYSTTNYNRKVPIEIEEKLKKGEIVKYENVLLIKEKNGKGNTRFLRTLRESCNIIDDHYKEFCKVDILGDIWNTSQGYGNIGIEGDVPFKNGKKPLELLTKIVKSSTSRDSIILDFFAGSGTTGHAVMQLNAEDGGNRKFILCQLDEDIEEDKNKEAFDFCKDNNFPPVISSITCERLNRAGKKIKQDFGEKAKDLDIGYKVFDLVSGEKLTLKQGELKIENQNNLNSIDKIYNLIFKVGFDNPLIQPKEIIKDCMYLCEQKNIKNYYIVNSKILDTTEYKKIFKQAIDTGNIYIDGWTATINTTLQENKDNIKIIF